MSSRIFCYLQRSLSSIHSGRPAPSPHDDPTTSDSVQTLVNNTSHPVAAASSSSLNYQPYRRHHKLSITDLGALTTGQGSVAVCGVVQYFKPPTQSRGSDYFITLGLLDETCTEEAINCILFNPSEQRLLTNIPVGEIVLLKGMKTSTFNDRPQATGYKEAIVVSNSGSNCLYLLSDTEKAIMKRLKEWSKQQGILQLNTKLSHINVDNFFNIICRVAAVYTSAADNRMMLKVFDGTAPKFSSESLDLTQGEWISDLDRQLVLEYAPLICDVLVFDWNGQFSIESGQYLSLSNVHVEFCKRGPFVNPSSIPTVKFTLSSKRSDGAITILYRGESKTIDDHLSNFFRPYGPFPVYKKTLSDHSSRPLFNIVAEEGKQVCSIHEAIKSPPETMLVIEGQIISFSRGPIEEMCQLRCSMCKTRYVTPQATDLPLPTQMVCVFCSDSKGSGPRVQYMYVFVMRLKDRTGTLDVCVTAEDGEMFLNQIQPVNLYTQKASRERLLKLLYLLTGGNDPFYPYPSVLDFERPCVKCCVTKFTSIEGKEQFTLIATVCSVSV